MNDLNATATQLAIDNSYYDNKSQECFELLSQLNDWADSEPCEVTFSVSVNNRPITNLPVPLSAWNTIAYAVTGLYAYYKERAAKARDELNGLKAVGTSAMPF